MIDTSGKALDAVLDEGVTVIKPNLIELMEFVAAPLDRDADRIAACRKLAADGRAEIVALTLGEHGALLVTAKRAWRALPMAIEPVSTVGAGDSFLGGLVAALASRQAAGRGVPRRGRRGVGGRARCREPDCASRRT